MNAIHDNILMRAYINLGQGVDIKPNDLLAEAVNVYIIWRNGLMDIWASRTAEARGVSLLPQHEKIMSLLAEVEPHYWNGLISTSYEMDEEATLLTLAYAIAAMRWHFKVRNGRLPESFSMPENELVMWLEKQVQIPVSNDPNQLSLFGG